ncbi:hypothetical protein DKW60_10880 [Leucothrix pacifica]|uniref:GH26 domain-containing protein n=2 Tax=Leucothrix pacifica TaxID=1247513 RepID=A0A317CFE3_9GAMM|nr:hypothetical protein DKW60_10880 [Leucothrix pacifica]
MLTACVMVCAFLLGCNGGTSVSSGAEAPFVSAYSVDKIQDRVLLGAYLDQDGWDEQIIDIFNEKLHKPISVINVFSSFDMDWTYLKYQSSNVVSRQAIPMITWMPTVNKRPDDSLLSEISDGAWDDYLYEWINGFRLWLANYDANYQPKVMIRFAHEFNSDWFPWSNQPDELIKAWRHIHQRFVAAGVAKHVEWVWNVNNVDVDDYNDFSVYYPGDDVVDWVSIDGYNWGSNYHYTRWKSFDETFSQSYVKLVTDFPDKPIMIAEVSSTEPADLPNEAQGQYGDDSDIYESKAAWVNDMLVTIENNYPAIKALVWFNSNKELNWALDAEHNTGLGAFNAGIERAHYTTLDEVSSTTVKRPASPAANVIPEVVGSELLQQEADYLRMLPRQQRQHLRQSRFASKEALLSVPSVDD